jgi:hypothetical protein
MAKRRRHTGSWTERASTRITIIAVLLRPKHCGAYMNPFAHDKPNHELAHGSPMPQLSERDHPFPLVLENSSFNATT